MKQPVRVAVTGAAGNIGYALAFRIAAGDMLGPDQPVILHLIEIEPALGTLEGVVMELADCAFPLLQGIVPTADLAAGFAGADFCLLVGARPARAGHGAQGPALGQRADLRAAGQGHRRARRARRQGAGGGQPGQHQRPDRRTPTRAGLEPRQFTAMTRLDHNRALSQLAEKTGTHVNDDPPHDDLGQPLRHAVSGHLASAR